MLQMLQRGRFIQKAYRNTHISQITYLDME